MFRFPDFVSTSLKTFLRKNCGWEADAWLAGRQARSDSVFPEARHFATDIEKRNVMVLAPHPDDEAIGAGGTLLANRNVGSRITVVFLTDGSGGRQDSDLVATRKAEAITIAEQYGFNSEFLNAPDTRLSGQDDVVSQLADLIRTTKPEQIFLPSFFEKHVDHFASNFVALAAIAEADTPDIDLLGYEVWNNIINPNYFVDTTEFAQEKRSMLNLYVTPMQETDYIALSDSRGTLHHFLQCFGLSSGFAEAFYRADVRTYADHFEQYVGVLEQSGSSLANLKFTKY